VSRNLDNDFEQLSRRMGVVPGPGWLGDGNGALGGGNATNTDHARC